MKTRNQGNRTDHLIGRILACRPDERIMLVSDDVYSDTVEELEQALSQKGIVFRSLRLEKEYDPADMPATVREAFLDTEYPVVIIGAVKNLWHMDERSSAKHDLKKRLVNLIHPARESVPSLFSDPGKYAEDGRHLERELRKGKRWRITAPGGTDLTGEFPAAEHGYFCELGDYSKGGSGGDFPSGEVGFGPKECSVEGTIAFDLKVQHVGKMTTPIRIRVNGDRIRVISNDEASRRYGRLIASEPVLAFISEVSFGINPDWSMSDDPISIVEEKNLGTAHFGHGGNQSYGTRKGQHFDAVIKGPDLSVDDRLILSGGKITRYSRERQ